MVSQDSRMHCKYKLMNDLWYYGALIVFQSGNEMKPAPLTFAWNPPIEILVSAWHMQWFIQ